MTNYSVITWTGTVVGSVAEAVAELETQLETIDNTKTIRYIDIIEKSAGRLYQAVLIYDA